MWQKNETKSIKRAYHDFLKKFPPNMVPEKDKEFLEKVKKNFENSSKAKGWVSSKRQFSFLQNTYT